LPKCLTKARSFGLMSLMRRNRGLFRINPYGPSLGLLEPGLRSNITVLSKFCCPSSFSVAMSTHPASGARIGCAHRFAAGIIEPSAPMLLFPGFSDWTSCARNARQSISTGLPPFCSCPWKVQVVSWRINTPSLSHEILHIFKGSWNCIYNIHNQ
jgi:hypothetical protein